MSNTTTLSFGLGNAKLSTAIGTFSLPAGHSCPFAKECQSRTDRITGKIIDGEHCRFRCFAATQELRYPSIRNSRWKNFTLLRNAQSVENMANLIQESLPQGITIFRVHVSGDFFSETYFLAWLNVALNNPQITFYGYTKALPLLVKYKKHLPSNFRWTASKGGTHDHLIKKHKLKFAEVVFSVEEAKLKNLEIDHDDSHAFASNKSFALLLHATQPAGTPAAKAWADIKKSGIGGYSKKKTRTVKYHKPIKIIVNARDGSIVVKSKKVAHA